MTERAAPQNGEGAERNDRTAGRKTERAEERSE